MRVDELQQGEYAIADNGTVVVGVSRRSLTPNNEDDAHVVCISTGIGAYPNHTLCEKVSRERAFEAALKD